MIRFNTIPTGLGCDDVINYENPVVEWEESLTDDSHFIPQSENNKSASPLTQADLIYFDFHDGKDTGVPVPISRIKGVDIAEISNSVVVQNNSITDKIVEAEELEKIAQKLCIDTTEATAPASE